MPRKRLLAIVAGLTLGAPLTAARDASASEPVQDIGVVQPLQPAQQAQPAPQYAPQYAQPAPQYAPQYAPVAPYPLARPRRYREGDPVPSGYHLEEKPRSGLVTAGAILLLIPYGIGAFAAVGASFRNESTWLVAPVVGPWLTLGRRDYCDRSDNTGVSKGLDCVADIFVVMGLVLSGVMQTTGATLLVLGLTSTKTELVRDEAKLRVRPMSIGSGYGIGLGGAF